MDGPDSTLLSVVIPAHDEERLIAGCLRALVDGAGSGELDVIVVCNGCSDETADRARAVAEELGSIRVVEIARSSKVAALNAGDRLARSGYRAYVDADVTVSASALRAVRRALELPGVLAAAPELHVDVRGASWGVRSHFRVWELSEYRRRSMIGSGLYAVNPSGRSRFGAFPDLVADDLFVKSLFDESERCTVRNHTFSVPAPGTVRALVRRSARAAAGNLQWQRWRAGQVASAQLPVDGSEGAASPGPRPFGAGPVRLVRRLAGHPALWPALAPYVAVYVVSRGLGRWKFSRGRMDVWERDETHRSAR